MKFFTKKYGPLPVWAWAIIAAIVGYLAYRWYRNRSGSSTTPTAVDNSQPSSGLLPDSGGGAGSLDIPNSTPAVTTGSSGGSDFTAPDTGSGDTGNSSPSPDPSTLPPSSVVPVTPPKPNGQASTTKTSTTEASHPLTTVHVGSTTTLEPKPIAANYLPAPSVKTSITKKSIPTQSSEAVTAKAIAKKGGVGKKALR